MKSLLIASTALILCALTDDTVTDYLSVKGPLTEFELKWSDKPNGNYYIQEYLPKTKS